VRIALFDSIRERHVCESLERALSALEHEVYWTGPVWGRHGAPATSTPKRSVQAALDEVLAFEPDALVSFCASTLTPGDLERVRGAGARTVVWLADDPVLYQVSYRHIIDHYDLVLHGGREAVLAFYEANHGHPTGVYFPFWTDAEAFPRVYDPDGDIDTVFLGNTTGVNRAGRYELLAGLPFDVAIYGTADGDPSGIVRGYLREREEISGVLGRSRVGITLSQRFSDYAGHPYDYPGLAGLGSFDLPSRVVQYAASGVPVLALSNDPCASFPEAIVATDRAELISRAAALLSDRERRLELSEATHRRFEQSFSADSRARALVELVSLGDAWRGWSVERRAGFFMDPPGRMRDVPSPPAVRQGGAPRLEAQHARPPADEAHDGLHLGPWRQFQQRARRVGALALARTGRLGKLVRSTRSAEKASWARRLRLLRGFAHHEGHARPAVGTRADGIDLGAWVSAQRRQREAGALDPDRVALLDEVPGFAWDARQTAWEERFDALRRFVDREGHANPPPGHRENGWFLAAWVEIQRRLIDSGRLPDPRLSRLERLLGG
jgi:Helicase associated domain/Glycosyl transferases group 1